MAGRLRKGEGEETILYVSSKCIKITRWITTEEYWTDFDKSVISNKLWKYDGCLVENSEKDFIDGIYVRFVKINGTNTIVKKELVAMLSCDAKAISKELINVFFALVPEDNNKIASHIIKASWSEFDEIGKVRDSKTYYKKFRKAN